MPKPEDLAGSYCQLGAELVLADGSSREAWAPVNANLLYTADGFVSVLSAPRDRQPVSGPHRPDLNAAPPEEVVEAVRDVIGYAGRYTLTEAAVEHHFDVSVNPNLTGRTLTRFIQLDGDDLVLSTPVEEDGSYHRIRWQRQRG